MDGKTIQEIRSVLLARWKRLGLNQAREAEMNHDLNMAHAEVIDIAQSLEQLGRDTSLQAAEHRESMAIERALAKMATGNFGICEDCAEEIPSKRLLVLPEARLCAHCQTYEEKQNTRLRFGGVGGR